LVTIISYIKHITPQITRTLVMPMDVNNHVIGTELATLADAKTYICLPAGAKLPANQPPEIATSIATVTLTPAQITEIKDLSPHVALIRSRVVSMIADKYSIQDEIKILKAPPGSVVDAYNLHVNNCRAWGVAEKAKLGL